MVNYPNFWLEQLKQQLNSEVYDELVGEFWLRIPEMDKAAAAGRQISKILEYEIRRAKSLLHNPTNRVRRRPWNETRTADQSTMDNMKIRRKW